MSDGNIKDARGQGESSAVGKRRTRWLPLIVALVLIVVIGVVTGALIYRDRVAPLKTVVLEVNGSAIDMRYFLKRAALVGGDPMYVLERLGEEQILRQVASEPPYNISVSDAEIDPMIRDMARGDDESVGESEIKEWYRQELNETGLTDEEYRELLRTAAMERELTLYLAARMPTSVEHIHFHMVPVSDQAAGNLVRERYQAGEDFASLAAEYSDNPAIAESGGEVGWLPRGVLNARTERVAFELEPGEVSEPFYSGEQLVVVMVSDRDDARELTSEALEVLRLQALDRWYSEVSAGYEVKYHGFENGYDSRTNAWVLWQLSRMQRTDQDAGSR